MWSELLWPCPAGQRRDDWYCAGVGWGGHDTGRYAVTGDSADLGRFRTPTLRDVARTAPYMHDGSIATLEEVVAFYDAGARPNPFLDPEIRPLGLTAAERAALVAYLRALSGTIYHDERR